MSSHDTHPPAVAHRRPSCLRHWRRVARPRLRLVCFPWCGGGAGVFRRMLDGLPPTVDAYAVQLPGREDRYGESPLRRMDAVVDHVLRELVHLSDLPLVLFGHSMGSVVAHATARTMLQRFGRDPLLLVVSGHDAPTVAQLDRSIWHDASDTDLLRNLGTLGGTPGALLADPGMMRMLLPAVRADYEVLETYHCADQPVLRCPLVACAGRQDDAVSAEGLAAWRRLSNGPFLEHWFDGGHFYLRDDPLPLMQQMAHWLADPTLSATTPAAAVAVAGLVSSATVAADASTVRPGAPSAALAGTSAAPPAPATAAASGPSAVPAASGAPGNATSATTASATTAFATTTAVPPVTA